VILPDPAVIDRWKATYREVSETPSADLERPSRMQENFHMTVPDQTAEESRIAERYLQVLNHLSLCADAVRHGDWDKLEPLARSLSHGAELLAEAARDQSDTTVSPRAAVVIDTVAALGGDCETTRALHPHRPATTSRTGNIATIDPFNQPGR
jgi:hypothetical protein